MRCSQNGLNFIAGWEGGRSSDGRFHAYLDTIAVPHIETIGFGQTRYKGGPVPAGLTWTLAEAEADLARSLAEDGYEAAVNALGVTLNQNQFDALCSFVYNLGPGSMQWDVGRDIKAGNFQAAADAMLQYDHAGGVRILGLTRRREAERALFLKPVKKVDPNHYGWYDDTTRLLDLPTNVKVHDEERRAAHRYDVLRALQTSDDHPHRAELARLRAECRAFADRIESVAKVAGHGGLSADHRRWRRDNLRRRQNGETVAK